MTQNDTGIVIVNWNSWEETIESLEAVFRMEDFRGLVVVCDNGSGDGSLEMIAAWARGLLCALPQGGAVEIRDLVIPSVAGEGVPFQCVSAEEIAQKDLVSSQDTTRLWLVDCGLNKGFAAGNNVGIQLLQRFDEIKWYWLLNCDALPARGAFKALRSSLPAHQRPVICGTLLLEYWMPCRIQSGGASFNRFFCSMRDNLRGAEVAGIGEYGEVMAVDYPVGASMVVNRRFVDHVGLMNEDYFLYFEELDWVSRLGWPSCAFVVLSSHVYHKGGATTSAGSTYRNRSLTADYHFLRSRMIFALNYGRFGGLIAKIGRAHV